jgi:hypothetical protein
MLRGFECRRHFVTKPQTGSGAGGAAAADGARQGEGEVFMTNAMAIAADRMEEEQEEERDGTGGADTASILRNISPTYTQMWVLYTDEVLSALHVGIRKGDPAVVRGMNRCTTPCTHIHSCPIHSYPIHSYPIHSYPIHS